MSQISNAPSSSAMFSLVTLARMKLACGMSAAKVVAMRGTAAGAGQGTSVRAVAYVRRITPRPNNIE